MDDTQVRFWSTLSLLALGVTLGASGTIQTLCQADLWGALYCSSIGMLCAWGCVKVIGGA